jgi:hypothetical protein
MSDITAISRQAWNSVKLDSQPDFDSLVRGFVLELEERALAVVETGTVDERDSHVARFEQAVKSIAEAPEEPEQEIAVTPLAMAAPIPEEVKEELVEEAESEPEPPPKKKPRKVQKREPQVPRKPKIIKAAAVKKPVAKKK